MLGSFDRLGYLRHRRRFVSHDLDVDLSDRVCLITGGNAGIGRATAAVLATHGATVRLMCRDALRGEQACEELQRETGSHHIDLVVLDISDLSAVRRVGKFLGRVDVLIHNAGVLPRTRDVTADELELTFATHVVGPHLLTRLLEPALRESADGRVIFVSSGGMYTQRLSLDDLAWDRRPYDGVAAYAQTKRMQVVLAEQWAARLADSAATACAMHPGWADTASVRTSLPRFYRFLGPVLRSAGEAADTVIWLAARQPAPTPRGAFWFDRVARHTHYLPWNREAAADRQALWDRCEELVG
jgi:NAD(P)-dependent dehydrogenase (short-subunit alcohol dehydrogenase family)